MKGWDMFTPGKIPSIGERSTHNWIGTDTEENYKNRGNKRYSTTDISYELNSNGYRCPEFDIGVKQQPLFIGCSVTFGVGLKTDEIWTHHIYEWLRKKYPRNVSQYNNLSNGGSGWDYVARTLMQVVPILQPSIVIAYMPTITRRELFWGRNNIGFQWVPNTGQLVDTPLQYIERLATQDQYTFYRTMMNLRMIEFVCSSSNTKLIWTTWDYEAEKVLKLYPPQSGYFDSLRSSVGSRVPDFARDGLHPGPNSHLNITDDFKKALEHVQIY